jgi:hypothetical protein
MMIKGLRQQWKTEKKKDTFKKGLRGDSALKRALSPHKALSPLKK